MVELADRLDGALQLLVVVQPAPHLDNLFAAQAELPSAPAGIADGQNRDRVPLAARTFRAAPAMANDTLEKRAPQELSRDRQAAEKFLARAKGFCVFHHPR